MGIRRSDYVVLENIHIPTAGGHWKFRGGGASQRPKCLKECMSLNWNFQRVGEGSNRKNPPWGEYGYFLEQHNNTPSRNPTTTL